MKLATAMHDLWDRPPLNIGGGDLASRVLATGILAWLTGLIAAGAFSYGALKIWLLCAAELGLVSVMLGLFLRSGTHFAGLQLLIGSLTMLWLISRGLSWLAVGVGLLFTAIELINVMTRRSRLNAILSVGPASSTTADRSIDQGGIFE